MVDNWVWFNVFDIRLKMLINFESNKNKIEWMIGNTLAWDLAETIAYKAAYECLKKGYVNSVLESGCIR